MTYIVALTGGICSGKSIVSKIFSKYSEVSIIDADIIAKKITQQNSVTLQMIAQYFGSNILNANGSLNRLSLKKRIFSNSTDKKWLEKLLHPLIRKETQKTIKNTHSKISYIIWVVPLLIENNLQKYANRTLVIDTYPNIQLQRILYRDTDDLKMAKKILLSQAPRQLRLVNADDIIENNSSLKNITKRIYTLHQKYLNILQKPAF